MGDLLTFFAIIAFLFLTKRVIMTSESFKSYGLTPGLEKEQVFAIAKYISGAASWNANKDDLRDFLYEVAIVESRAGLAKDSTTESGAGVWQFDKNAFLDTKAWIQKKKKQEFEELTGVEIENMSYYDLTKNPIAAAFFARAYFFTRIPGKIGTTIEERALQWKKYYNTYLGAGSVEKYIKRVRDERV